MALIFDTRLVRDDSLLTSELDDEVVMLSLEAGRYYGLNGVGSRIWNLLEQPRTLRQICDILLSEYEVTPEQCEREVRSLAQELLDENLAHVVDAV